MTHGEREPLHQDPLTKHYLIGLTRRAAQDTRMAQVVGASKWRAFCSSVYAIHDNSQPNTRLRKLLNDISDQTETAKLDERISDRSKRSPLAYARAYLHKSSASDEHEFSAVVLEASPRPDSTVMHFEPLRSPAELDRARQNWLNVAALNRELSGALGWMSIQESGERCIYLPRDEYSEELSYTRKRTLAHEFAHTQIDLRLGNYLGRIPNEVAAKLASDGESYERDTTFLEAVSVISDIDICGAINRVTEQEQVIDFYTSLERGLGASHLLMLVALQPDNYKSTPVAWPLASRKDARSAFLQTLVPQQLRTRSADNVCEGFYRGFARTPVERTTASVTAKECFGVSMPHVVEEAFTTFKINDARNGPMFDRVAAHQQKARSLFAELSVKMADLGLD